MLCSTTPTAPTPVASTPSASKRSSGSSSPPPTPPSPFSLRFHPLLFPPFSTSPHPSSSFHHLKTKPLPQPLTLTAPFSNGGMLNQSKLVPLGLSTTWAQSSEEELLVVSFVLECQHEKEAVESSASFGRKVARSRSVGMRKLELLRGFLRADLDRVWDCTLRQVAASEDEQDGDGGKEEEGEGEMRWDFWGFEIISTLASPYWLSAVEEEFDGGSRDIYLLSLSPAPSPPTPPLLSLSSTLFLFSPNPAPVSSLSLIHLPSSTPPAPISLSPQPSSSILPINT